VERQLQSVSLVEVVSHGKVVIRGRMQSPQRVLTSVSACTGAGDDPVGNSCYPHKFFDWWNTVFPHPANELTNGAVKKTDSAYYAYCNSHHMPDKTDLVILEFDAADPK